MKILDQEPWIPAAHPPEFRRRAVELARLGAATAKDLGISESCLRNWTTRTTLIPAARRGVRGGSRL